MRLPGSRDRGALDRAEEAYRRREDARGGRTRDSARAQSREYREASAEMTRALQEATPEERRLFFRWETGR